MKIILTAKHLLIGAGIIAAFAFGVATSNQAQVQQGGIASYLGEVRLFGQQLCPPGWVLADGRLLPIASHKSLFSLYGIHYGGNGVSTFAIPDLRGRAAISQGSGPGLKSHAIGNKGGSESFTLKTSQLARHAHEAVTSAVFQATTEPGNLNSPEGNVLANDGNDNIYADVDPNVNMRDMVILTETIVDDTGAGEPKEHRGPFLTMNYCVSLSGIFPSNG